MGCSAVSSSGRRRTGPNRFSFQDRGLQAESCSETSVWLWGKMAVYSQPVFREGWASRIQQTAVSSEPQWGGCHRAHTLLCFRPSVLRAWQLIVASRNSSEPPGMWIFEEPLFCNPFLQIKTLPSASLWAILREANSTKVDISWRPH